MNTSNVIVLARKHVHNDMPMRTSAELCLSDAIDRYDSGNFESAKMWALKSLAYSVGVFHNDYIKAAR